ncbi:hypothetical protein SDC9_112708 [bioreactor metagenome]|uniref:Uncharacterized protein n=1 Tax=bioreactor metagenome TaxID=1076179 RepID=A0A645BKM0_9ZZZZ
MPEPENAPGQAPQAVAAAQQRQQPQRRRKDHAGQAPVGRMQLRRPQKPLVEGQLSRIRRQPIQESNLGAQEFAEMAVVAAEGRKPHRQQCRHRQSGQNRQTLERGMPVKPQPVEQPAPRQHELDHRRKECAMDPVVRQQHRGQGQRQIGQKPDIAPLARSHAATGKAGDFQQPQRTDQQLRRIPARHRQKRRAEHPGQHPDPPPPFRTGLGRQIGHQKWECKRPFDQILPGIPSQRRCRKGLDQSSAHRQRPRHPQHQKQHENQRRHQRQMPGQRQPDQAAFRRRILISSALRRPAKPAPQLQQSALGVLQPQRHLFGHRIARHRRKLRIDAADGFARGRLLNIAVHDGAFDQKRREIALGRLLQRTHIALGNGVAETEGRQPDGQKPVDTDMAAKMGQDCHRHASASSPPHSLPAGATAITNSPFQTRPAVAASSSPAAPRRISS